MEKQLIIRCSNIQKKFVTDKKSNSFLQVLRGIDLEIYEGEIVSIVGSSGAGKSTLLHILGGLDKPTEGEVYWGEKNISELNDETLAKLRTKEVGFVFQFHHLLPEFTALENVAMPQMILGKTLTAAQNSAKSVLPLVGLAERSNHKPSELSGGEQQRIAIARAIVNKPKVVLADEPTGNLDSATSEELFSLIQSLNKENKQTFIIATHNENLAHRSHRVLRIEDGKLFQL
ncbi:MAG: ABC transporter ATP-binding protein [Bacteroidota bacterium]|nr:ABC transporter ATP-binding protein [Bacteroidota bacterium]